MVLPRGPHQIRGDMDPQRVSSTRPRARSVSLTYPCSAILAAPAFAVDLRPDFADLPLQLILEMNLQWIIWLFGWLRSH